MAGTLRVWVNGAWEDVGGAAAPVIPEEVVAGTAAPTDAATDLWVDTTDPAAPVLKVKDAGGLWIVAPPPPVIPDEVHIGADDPYLTDPAGTWELWIQPDVPHLVIACPSDDVVYTGSFGIPQNRGHIRMGGLTPGNSYTAKADAATTLDSNATQVAPASGELDWHYYTASAGWSGTVTIHDGATNTDPVLHSQPFTSLANVPLALGAGYPQVGVVNVFTVGPGLKANWPHTLALSGGGAAGATVAEPLTQTSDGTGTLVWTVTPATADPLLSIAVMVEEAAGSQCPPTQAASLMNAGVNP